MRLFLLSAALIVSTVAPALSAENDWRECTGNDPARAIAACSRVMRSAGSKEVSASAHYNRGLAYAANGEPDRAIPDFNEAIRLDPADPDAFVSRGSAYFAIGEHARAISNFDEALKLDPMNGQASFNRALAYFYVGSLADARDGLHRTIELEPDYPYAVLWLDIVERRSKLPSHLPQTVGQLDTSGWPAQLIRLFLGQATAVEALAATDVDPITRKGQICEVNFYSGELALLQESKNEAVRLFRLAANDCPRTFKEWMAANAELRAIGISSLEPARARRSN
jgi:lipoprotein NlpI